MYAAMTKGDGNAADERFSSAHPSASDDKIYHRNRIAIMYRSVKFFRECADAIHQDLDVPEQTAALIEQQLSCTGKLFDKIIEALANRAPCDFGLRNTTREMLQEGRNLKRDTSHRMITCRPTATPLILESHQGISSSERPTWPRMPCQQAT